MQSRAFCFTLNNPETKDGLIIPDSFVYLGYAVEKGTLGTLHLQGLCYTPTRMRIGAVSKLLYGAHVEIMKGTFAEARAYCKGPWEPKHGDHPSKPENPTFKEFGIWPRPATDRVEQGGHSQKGNLAGQKEKERWARIWSLAESGDMETIKAEEPQIALQYLSGIERIMRKKQPTLRTVEKPGHWWWGESGAGKSKTARECYPNAFIKSNSIWWDMYDGQREVIVEDVDIYDVKMAKDLKVMLDHYAFPVQYKGGMMMIRPEVVIVTSQYKIEEIWNDEKTIAAIKRRCEVREFKKGPMDKFTRQFSLPPLPALGRVNVSHSVLDTFNHALPDPEVPELTMDELEELRDFNGDPWLEV